MKNQQFLEESNTMKKIYLKKKGVSWKEKKKKWKDIMDKHVKVKQKEFEKWKNSLENPDYDNVTSDPFKTLIVYNLVN